MMWTEPGGPGSRTVRCYFNGRLVYEVQKTRAPVEEIRRKAAAVYSRGDVTKIHVFERVLSAARFAATN